jgi:hypothetical protein
MAKGVKKDVTNKGEGFTHLQHLAMPWWNELVPLSHQEERGARTPRHPHRKWEETRERDRISLDVLQPVFVEDTRTSIHTYYINYYILKSP